MRPALAALLLVVLAAWPGGTPAFAQAESREGIYLQNQILQLRQELDQLRRGGGSSLGGVPVAPPPRGATGGPQGELVGQLLDRVAAMEEEVRRLRGRLDESEFRGRQLGQAVEKLQGDIDYRLQQLEGGGRPPAAQAPTGQTPAAQTPAGPAAAAPRPNPPAPAAPAAARPPERAIADGRAALARRDFAAAEAAAREALGVRNSPRATDAQLLLADALGGKRDFAGAALAYNEAFTRSRSGPRAPEALVGLASSFASLGSRREACDTLDDLRSNFPNLGGPQAERAAETRRRAGCR